MGPPDVADVGTDGGPSQGPRLGILQFEVRHNLDETTCLVNQDCRLRFHAPPESTEALLKRIEAQSNMAILHLDRPIPWLAFAEGAPNGADLVQFYERRAPPSFVSAIEPYVQAFARQEVGYLAVSVLSGTRDHLSENWLDQDRSAATTERCPSLSPDTVIEGPEGRFELGPSYARFLRYLLAKLRPSYLGLMVEANLYRSLCPTQWASLVELYHAIYDALRPETSIPLFATLSWPPLLGYSYDRCHAPLELQSCGETRVPREYPPADPEVCFPAAAAELWDLAEGDRMDLLALSFYPDGLGLAGPGALQADIDILSFDDEGDGMCQARVLLPPDLDPFEPLDRLGWTGPVALAEWSARSCPSLFFESNPEPSLLRHPGDNDRQAAWMDRVLREARDRNFVFVAHSFLEDYPPVHPEFHRAGVLDQGTYNLFNVWPCSGLFSIEGQAKGAVTERWQSELRRR